MNSHVPIEKLSIVKQTSATERSSCTIDTDLAVVCEQTRSIEADERTSLFVQSPLNRHSHFEKSMVNSIMTAEGGLMASKAWLELEASSALAVVSTGPAAP